MVKPLHWHSLQAKEAVAELQSNIAQGLSHSEAKNRLMIFLHQFLSPLIYLLLFAAGIAVLIGEAKDAAVILVVVMLNAVIGAIQEGRAESSAVLYSFVQTAKANGLDAYNCIHWLLLRFPHATTVDDYEQLLPHRAKKLLIPDIA